VIPGITPLSAATDDLEAPNRSSMRWRSKRLMGHLI